MKTICALIGMLLLFTYCPVEAKTINEYLKSADSLSNNYQFDSAIVIGLSAYDQAEKRFGVKDTTTARVLDALGGYYHLKENYNKAESYLRRALDIKKSIHGANNMIVVNAMEKLANTLFRNDYYPQAETLLNGSLAIRDSIQGQDHIDATSCLNSLGNVYRKMQKYDAADSILQRSLSLTAESFGRESPDAAECIEIMGDLYYSMGEMAKAESLYTHSLSIIESSVGIEHLDYVRTLESLAFLYYKYDQNFKAESLYVHSFEIRKKLLGENHVKTAYCLIRLGYCYNQINDYTKAEEYYRKGISIAEGILGVNHPRAAIFRNGLGNTFNQVGRFSDGEKLHRSCLEILEKNYNPEHSLIAMSASNLAWSIKKLGKYEEVERLLTRALNIRLKIYGENNTRVASDLQLFGEYYGSVGKFKKAAECLRRTLEIKEKVFGPDHTEVAIALNGLAINYDEMGESYDTEPLYLRAMSIYEKKYGPDHKRLAIFLNNLGLVYYDKGNYAEAERYLLRSLSIAEIGYGREFWGVALCLDNLASVYKKQGRYAEAEPLYKRGMDIYAKSFGQDHKGVAECLMNLATLYGTLDEKEKADSLLTKAVALYEEFHGKENPITAEVYYHLGKLYIDLGRWEEAEHLLIDAISIKENVYGEENYLVSNSLEALAKLRLKQNNPEAAADLAKRASENRIKNLIENLNILSEKDALTYSQFSRNAVNFYLTSYFNLKEPSKTTTADAANMIFSIKGLISDGIFERQKSIDQNKDSVVLALEESLKVIKYQLSKLFINGPGENIDRYRDKVDSLEKSANQIEANLWRSSAGYREHKKTTGVTVDRITSLLPEHATLIEYMKYKYYDPVQNKLIPRYLALVVSKTRDPQIVDLGEAAHIDVIVKDYRDHMHDIKSANMLYVAEKEKATFCEISKRLIEKIWSPIHDLISHDGLTLIASDGTLNLVSFASLIGSTGKYFIEKYTIHNLSAGRDLVRYDSSPNIGKGLFALGDPNFNATISERIAESTSVSEISEGTDYDVIKIMRSNCGEFKKMRLGPLPGTRIEVNSIISGWQDYSKEPITVYFYSKASEENFKEKAPGNRIIHLATHGYFFSSDCQESSEVENEELNGRHIDENPLLRSGLFFAGANLQGDSLANKKAEDGILTAYEVSAMNFEGTELVVLSACETGLGEVKTGEGVYGLRRAFEMAGARTVISALWPVSDLSAAQILGRLYGQQEKSLPVAMQQALIESIGELRSQGNVDHPFNWAGFVIVGDWR